MPCVRVNAIRPGRLAMPSRSSRSISSGKWRMPFARPWVSDASQNPPFRPLAPNPTVSGSSTTTRSDGIRVGQGDRRPQPGEPAPDDGDIGRGVADERGQEGRARLAQPVTDRFG